MCCRSRPAGVAGSTIPRLETLRAENLRTRMVLATGARKSLKLLEKGSLK